MNSLLSPLEYLKSLTLLCVEDNKTTQLLCEATLEDLFYKIHFADNGEDGYNKFNDENIDIIITDFDMPILNGLEMTEKIRALNEDVPIVLVSAIEDVEVFKIALNLGVNNFVSKPFDKEKLLNVLKKIAQSLVGQRYIKEQQKRELKTLQKKDTYNSYQEDLAFEKELNILRNDFYYQLIDEKHLSLVDFLYQPLDVISGDAYTARRIDGHRTFYLIVDGMGKGLSASLTAMLMTSFVNHIIDKMIEYESFSLDILIKESMDYIKPILLDEEALAIDYILFDTSYDMLFYAKFAMPVMLMQDNKGNIVRVKSNNPPLSKWQPTHSTDEINVSNIEKFLFYSDGIVENETKGDGKVYADFIENDFKHSFTREDLKTRFFEKIDKAEDDITLIFINRLSLDSSTSTEMIFDSTLENVDNASQWYSEVWAKYTNDVEISYHASVVFTELYMNAFEHGNLGIDSYTKHKLLEDDTYFETLSEKGLTCQRKITVKVNQLVYKSTSYVITQIIDEGEGFDTQILSEIFRNRIKFNGRGVFVSRKNSLGIYYNSKGNSVLYLNKI